MNKIFRLIWSTARQCWVVAAEKVSSKGGIPARTVGSLAAVALLAAGNAAFALPSGNSLVAGQATVSTPAAGQMQINQASNRAIINWQSFGIAAGEAVNISQPNSQAALLNRVVGNSGSEIFGKLTANGQVFLVNPNGVLFGRGAEVNVGGLVASSLNIANDDFMNSNLKFFKDGTAGSVLNQGSISAGFAALLGPIVDNGGSIITYKGSTALGAADAVTLNFDTQGLIALKLEQGAYNAQVLNSGIIEADGGRVLLTAKSADDVLKSMVNTSGVIRARTVENRNGEILLLGDMQNGTTMVDGIIDATAPTSGNGGFVETSAAKVQVTDSSRVTTLAANGQNGTWLIDPDGFTIAASGGDMTGLAVQTALAGGNFSILSTSGSGADGNINVNDAITWNANQLTLTATNDINVNAVMTANGTASVDFEPGSGKLNMGLSGSGFYGRVDFPGRSGAGFLTIGGQDYTVINSLGAAGSVTGTDLQGINGNLAGKYALGADIDATATSGWNAGAGLSPVGTSASRFSGNFNGLGHIISNLRINLSTTDGVGLFGSKSGEISNVGLSGVNVAGKNYVGGLVGDNYSGSIRNSYVSGVVTGTSSAGGLAGYNYYGSIITSYASVNVTGYSWLGGLTGYNYGYIQRSYSTGSVSGNSWVGGLTGASYGGISSSYSIGSVNGVTYVGGLVGVNYQGSITNSYSSGSVSGSSSVGGLAGANQQYIGNSYWNITTSGQAASAGGSGLTTAQMQQQASFTGFDFSTTWRIYEGNSYPLLKSFLAPLTITASNATKTYDGNPYSNGNGVTYSIAGAGASPNLLGTLAYGGTSQGAINAGTYAITPGGYYSNQQGYDISFADGTLTVDKAALAVTANNAAKTYGQAITFAGTEFTSSGLQNGETIGSVSLASAGAAATANVSGSPYSITASNASGGTFNAGNYTITYNNGSLTISPAALTVTANNASKTYGQTTTFAGTEFTSTGLQNSETIGSVSLASAGAAATANVSGSPYSITASNASGGTFSAGNYTITYNNGSLTISPAALTVTANNASKTYGDTVTFTGTEFTSSGLQNGETIGSVSLASAGAAANANVSGSPYSITASNASGGTFNAGNYSISYNNGSLTISPAALSVTANNASKTYGDTVTFSGSEFTSSGLQNGETIGSVSLASTGAAANANVSGSPYGITASNATGGSFNAGNYTITYQNGSLTINPAALSVAANNASKAYGQTATFAGTEFTSTGLQNGETIGSVSLASTGAAATANVSGSPYSITVSNANGGTFNASNYSITYNNGQLTISPAALTVTANNASKTYGQTTTFAGTEFTSTGLQNSETIGSVSLASTGAAATANVSGSPYSITASNASGGTFNAGNYSITYNNGSLTINPAALSVTANNASKTYGQTTTFAGTEFTSTGLQNGETIVSVTLTSAGAAAMANVSASPYSIMASNATGGTFSAGNYSITYNNGSLIINPATLTITGATAQNKVYDGTTAATISGAALNGVIGADVVSISGGGTFTDKNVANDKTVTAALVLGGASAGNYSLTQPQGLTADITPAPITVTANNASKTYGDTVTFTGTEFTSSGLQNGETIGSVSLASTGAAATANVSGSPYSITASNASGGTFNAGNYSISYQNGTLTISPAALTVTANNAAKTYGQAISFAGSEFTSSGLQNGETIGSVSLASTGATATANVSGSPYTITASNASGGTFNAGNYSISYNNGSLTISPAALSVIANNAAKNYGQAITFAGSEFTSSGLQNGETIGSVSLASTGAAATANVSGSPYSITASNASGGTFSAGNYTITYNNGSLTISPAALTVTVNNASKTYGDTVTFTGTEFTSSGLQNGETIGSVSLASTGAAATANVSGSPYSITASNASGGTFSAGNYSISYNNGSLTISPAALTVTANNDTKMYSGTPYTGGNGVTYSGFVNNEMLSVLDGVLLYGGDSQGAKNPGSYVIAPSGLSSGNYAIRFADGNLEITKPPAMTQNNIQDQIAPLLSSLMSSTASEDSRQNNRPIITPPLVAPGGQTTVINNMLVVQNGGMRR